jgi:hypothetical protein
MKSRIMQYVRFMKYKLVLGLSDTIQLDSFISHTNVSASSHFIHLKTILVKNGQEQMKTFKRSGYVVMSKRPKNASVIQCIGA